MEDLASHGRKDTPRAKLMRETYGVWYVYFTYGMHHCINITCGEHTIGAVLIRAIEPLEGIPKMQKRRNTTIHTNLGSGPAKAAQALGITTAINGTPLHTPIELFDAPTLPPEAIVSAPRIGISADTHLLWRFYEKSSPYSK